MAMVLNGNSNLISCNSLSDPSKHAELYRYLESLKKDENGWRNSVRNIVSNSLSNPEEHFLLLQVIEDFLQRRYLNAAPDDVQIVREFLFHWMKYLRDASKSKPVFILNKMAHVFAMVFAADFPVNWPTFFDDLFFSENLLEQNCVQFYMKVLLAIDSEVVDRDIQRSKTETDRNVKIKDGMRDVCIQKIAQSWPTIMANTSDDAVQCLVLDVIAAYVDWIDVDLVANDAVMSLVIDRLAKPATSESASNAICGLLQKGMPPERKVLLVMTLMNVLRANRLLAIDDASSEDDVMRVGSLVNTLGLVMLDTYAKLAACSIMEKEQEALLGELRGLAEPELAVLNNANNELSELTVDVLRSYASFLLRTGATCDALCRRIIDVVLTRYVMGDELNVDGDGEDETEFGEYRRELRSLLNVVGNKRPELILDALEPWVAEVTAGGSRVPVNRIEALLQFVLTLHEVIPSNLLQSPREGIAERASRIPVAILEGLQLDGRSSTTHVLYFEVACRYERLLALRPQPAVPLIAAAFLDQRGIATPNVNSRTRIVYLFCRFVKTHKAVLGPLVSEVIKRLAPLLAVSPEADDSQLLSPDDQAFIFEATATLIVYGDFSVELKAQYFGELASTLAIKFEAAAVELAAARTRNDKEMVDKVLDFMSHLIVYCSRMSKAFNSVQPMKSCNCVEIYLRLLKLFTTSVSTANSQLLEAYRQFAHRMVACLEAELLPFLRVVFDTLVEVSVDMDSMNHLLIFCHQTVAKYKKNIYTSGVSVGRVLAIASQFALADQPVTNGPKDERMRAILYVQRSFLQLLLTALTSDCWEALAQDQVVDGLLETSLRIAMTSTDQTSQRLALSSLAKATQHVPAWSQKTLRLALELPAQAHISAVDVGSTIVVHEVCTTLASLFESDRAGFSQAIRQMLPEAFCNRLVNALINLNGKALDKEVMTMYAQMKAQQTM